MSRTKSLNKIIGFTRIVTRITLLVEIVIYNFVIHGTKYCEIRQEKIKRKIKKNKEKRKRNKLEMEYEK